MTLRSRTGDATPALSLSRPGTAFRGMALHACPEAYRAQAQLSLYHQPALSYPVARLLHRLTPRSLMASLHLHCTKAPVLAAAVERDGPLPQLAITHVPRPFVRELAGYLHDGLGLRQASVTTTRDTAEGLEREWPRVTGSKARLQPQHWTWHQLKQPKPVDHALPAESGIAYAEMMRAGRENPATARYTLLKGDEKLASIGMQQLTGQNRYLMGDLQEEALEGEAPALLPLFNAVIARAAQNRQALAVVMGSERLGLRSQLLAGHLANCEAVYRRVDLLPGGMA